MEYNSTMRCSSTGKSISARSGRRVTVPFRNLFTLNPAGNGDGDGVLAQEALKLDGGTAAFSHFDHIARLDQVGGDVAHLPLTVKWPWFTS